MNAEIDICRAGPSEVSLVVEMRVRSYVERHRSDAREIDAFRKASDAAFAAALADGSLRAWIAYAESRPVGTACLMLLPSLPRLGATIGWSGNVYDGRIRNVYVEPEFRRRGVALALMRAVIADAAAAGVDRLTLGTSTQGRPLYEFLGFVQKEDEMIFER